MEGSEVEGWQCTHRVQVLPHTEVATDAVLLEDRAHVRDVDGRHARLSDQAVRDPHGVVALVATGNVDDDFLLETTDLVSIALDLRTMKHVITM